MSQFDAEKFKLEPSQDIFSKLRKDELILLAKHLELEVKKAMKKHDIQDIILKHLVSEGVFEEMVLEKYEASKPKLSPEQQCQLELKKLEMKERMQERMEEKERQERMEERERQERMEEKERQERMEEKERQARMEEKERQERMQEK